MSSQPSDAQKARNMRAIVFALTLVTLGLTASLTASTPQASAAAVRYYAGDWGPETKLCIEWPEKRTSTKVTGRIRERYTPHDADSNVDIFHWHRYRATVKDGRITMTITWEPKSVTTYEGGGDAESLYFYDPSDPTELLGVLRRVSSKVCRNLPFEYDYLKK